MFICDGNWHCELQAHLIGDKCLYNYISDPLWILRQVKCVDITSDAAAAIRDAEEEGVVRPCPVLVALATVDSRKAESGPFIHITSWFDCGHSFWFKPYTYIRRFDMVYLKPWVMGCLYI